MDSKYIDFYMFGYSKKAGQIAYHDFLIDYIVDYAKSKYRK
jgi:hypothetical protein